MLIAYFLTFISAAKYKVRSIQMSKKVNIEFRDIRYHVETGVLRKSELNSIFIAKYLTSYVSCLESKEILKNVSGVFKACELTAVFGPSGSGKSSLMNILTGFFQIGTKGNTNVSGVVEVNDNRKRAFIMQEENLHKLLTVNESMTFSINLKTGSKLSQVEKKCKVDEILSNLGLESTADSYVEYLSGGQQRRLSIALELVDDPSVIFLDEPTTGLDSSSTTQCVRLLKKLAEQGKTVICTIHTPSALVLKMFDHLYALADGLCIYQGSCVNLIPFLSESGLHCPETHNPSDFLMEIANNDYGPQTVELSKRIENGANENYRKNKPDKNYFFDEFQLMEKPKIAEKLTFSTATSPFCNQMQNLLLRNLLILYRDKTIMWLRLGAHVTVAILVGLFFQNVGDDGSRTISNLKMIYAMSLFMTYTGFYSLLSRISLEISIIKREHFNGWYSTGSYYLASSLVDLPLTVFCVSITVAIVYVLSDQPPELFRFVTVVLIQILLSLVGQGLGMMIGAFFELMVGSLFSNESFWFEHFFYL